MASKLTALCYNKGCGQRFNPDNNPEDACMHHPGSPVFHDAYKGWSCCKKKCTDFTEFLNIKGCSTGPHNGVKPPEPEKVKVEKSEADKIIEYKAPEPVKPSTLERPPFDSPLVKLKTSISPSLSQELEKKNAQGIDSALNIKHLSDEVKVGALCKNGGCKETYVNEDSNDLVCTYHPGVPIFHEGLKYWTCCTRRTTDFQAFLNQEGCTTGTHKWKNEKEEQSRRATQCRHDMMQTATHVTVNVYCKQYDPLNEELTYIEVNPIRLRIRIYFPDSQATYANDFELKGIIDTVNSSVLFTPTKVEIKLKKAEPMSWNRLDIPRPASAPAASASVAESQLPKVDALDLSDL